MIVLFFIFIFLVLLFTCLNNLLLPILFSWVKIADWFLYTFYRDAQHRVVSSLICFVSCFWIYTFWPIQNIHMKTFAKNLNGEKYVNLKWFLCLFLWLLQILREETKKRSNERQSNDRIFGNKIITVISSKQSTELKTQFVNKCPNDRWHDNLFFVIVNIFALHNRSHSNNNIKYLAYITNRDSIIELNRPKRILYGLFCLNRWIFKTHNNQNRHNSQANEFLSLSLFISFQISSYLVQYGCWNSLCHRFKSYIHQTQAN